MNKKQRKTVVEEVLGRYEDLGLDTKKVFFLGDEPEEFAAAIVGTIEIDGSLKIVYDENKILAELGRLNRWSLNSCIEWYEYNIARSLPYYKNIVVMDLL